MSSENVDLVRSAYVAFRRGDTRAIFRALDPGVVFSQSLEVPWGGKYRGPEEVSVFLYRLTSAVASEVDPNQFMDAGDTVVAVGVTRGKALATGKDFEVPAVHVWTVKNGKILRFEAYIDNPLMLDALRP